MCIGQEIEASFWYNFLSKMTWKFSAIAAKTNFDLSNAELIEELDAPIVLLAFLGAIIPRQNSTNMH